MFLSAGTFCLFPASLSDQNHSGSDKVRNEFSQKDLCKVEFQYIPYSLNPGMVSNKDWQSWVKSVSGMCFVLIPEENYDKTGC